MKVLSLIGDASLPRGRFPPVGTLPYLGDASHRQFGHYFAILDIYFLFKFVDRRKILR
jgi:hypothetical protein